MLPGVKYDVMHRITKHNFVPYYSFCYCSTCAISIEL